MPDEPTAGTAGTGGPTAERTFSQSPAAEPPGEGPGAPGANPGAWSQNPGGGYGQGDPYGQGAQPGQHGGYFGPGPTRPGSASEQSPWPYGPADPTTQGQPASGQFPPGQPRGGQPGAGHYAGSGYGPYGAPYGQSPYGEGREDPYGPGAYGPGAYGPGPYGQGSYGPGSYGGYGPPSGGYGGPGQGPYQGHRWPYVPPRPKRSPEELRRRNRRLLGFLGVFVVFLGVGILIGALIAPTNPTTVADGLVSKTMAAATQAGTYHYVDLATIVGVYDDITGDAGPNGGRQTITERCSDGKNVFNLRLVKGVVYFRGNAAAVVDQLGVATSKATSEADKWVKVTKGESPYSSFAEGITTTSNISQLKTTIVPSTSSTDTHTSPPTTKVTGALRLSKTESGGTAALVITTSSSLPRSLTGEATGTDGRYTLQWTFSHFREKLDVVAPASSVAYSSLHATPPSKTVCG